MTAAVIVRFAIFFSIATSLMGGLHYYVYARFSRYLSLQPHDQRTLKWILLSLFLVMWAAMPLSRAFGRQVPSVVLWIAYIWMGTLALLCVTLLGSDVMRLLVALAAKAQAAVPPDPERRALFGRVLAYGTLGLAGAMSGYALFQGLRRVAVKRVAIPLKRLPAELAGFRIVQLTDVHIGPTLDGRWLKQVVEQVNGLAPDVIAITGDLVDGSVEALQAHVAPLGQLRARHGVYFVTGNHEYYSGADEWISELRRLGIRVLRNERVTLRPGQAAGPGASPLAIDLIGIDDFQGNSHPGHGPDLPRAVAGREASNVAVLLAHQPRAVEEAAKHGIDVQLSGHTHGGQLWPWGYLVRLQQPYVAGLIKHVAPAPKSENANADAASLAHTMLYVSCGTGYWGPPMRLGAPAEITEVTLHPEGAA